MSVPDVDTLPSANATIGGRTFHPNARRATVNCCCYCMSENLFPSDETDNAWECRECLRVFTVKFHGQLTQ